MTKLHADLEALMPEPGQYAVADQAGPRWYFRGCILWPTKHQADAAARTDLGTRDSIPLFTADQVRAAILGATERAANIAQAKLDGEGSGVQDDWTADGGWDWACMQIRDAIRAASMHEGGGKTP
jgi:hypothetical protein